jgi:hypothetical protein
MRDYNNKNTYALGAGIYTYPPSKKSKSFNHAPHMKKLNNIKHKKTTTPPKKQPPKKRRFIQVADAFIYC